MEETTLHVRRALAGGAVEHGWVIERFSPFLEPIELRIDGPFLFAIQATTSGACLMLGRVTDPR